MKLIGITKNKKTKDENGENVPYLEISAVVLGHCNTVNNNYKRIQESCTQLSLTKSSSRLLVISSKNFKIFQIF